MCLWYWRRERYQDSPESGYVVRQQLGEWQALAVQWQVMAGCVFFLVRFSRRVEVLRRRMIPLFVSYQKEHATVPQLGKVHENLALRKPGCLRITVGSHGFLRSQFPLLDLQDSELATNVVQLMVKLTTRVGHFLKMRASNVLYIVRLCETQVLVRICTVFYSQEMIWMCPL